MQNKCYMLDAYRMYTLLIKCACYFSSLFFILAKTDVRLVVTIKVCIHTHICMRAQHNDHTLLKCACT